MTETEEVTRGLPGRSRCGREMDCSGREKFELKLSGLGAIRSKWGSIRIMVDDGWGEVARGTRRVKSAHHKRNLCMHPHIKTPTHTLQAGKHKQRLLADGRSITPTDAISINQCWDKLSLLCKHKFYLCSKHSDIQMFSRELAFNRCFHPDVPCGRSYSVYCSQKGRNYSDRAFH